MQAAATVTELAGVPVGPLSHLIPVCPSADEFAGSSVSLAEQQLPALAGSRLPVSSASPAEMEGASKGLQLTLASLPCRHQTSQRRCAVAVQT